MYRNSNNNQRFSLLHELRYRKNEFKQYVIIYFFLIDEFTH